jgi:8-oxo-dGTP diphosphatase
MPAPETPAQDIREYPPRPIVGIGVLVLKSDAVLLIQRGKQPNLGTWSLPGGAQELGETCEHAARRELAEETGLRVGSLVLAACIDIIRKDTAGRIHYHYTIIDYAAQWQDGEPVAGGDAMAARFVAFDRLDDYALAAAAQAVISTARGLLGL